MSTHTYNKRTTAPQAPATGQVRQWVGEDGIFRYIDENGLIVEVVKGDKGDKGDQGDQGEKGDIGDTGPVGPEGPAGGISIAYSEDSDTEITIPSSTTPVYISGFSFNAPVQGDYLLMANIAVEPHSTSNDLEMQWELDGVDVGAKYAEEHKDSSNAQSNLRSWQINLKGVGAGGHTLWLYAWQESASGGGKLKYTSFTLWRIA